MKSASKSAEDFLNEGDILKSQGRLQEAVTAYNNAISLKPDFTVCLCNRAIVLRRLNRKDEALQDFRAASYSIAGQNKLAGVSEYTNSYLKEALKSFADLEKVVDETQKAVEDVNQKDPTLQKVVDRFKILNKTHEDLASNAIDIIEHNQNSKQEALIQELLNQYKQLQQEIIYLKQIQQKQDELLKKGGVYDAAEIKTNLEILQKEGPELAIYYKIFYWTLMNYLQAYRIVNTNIIKTNNTFDATNSDKAIGFTIEAGKAIPVLGGFVRIIDEILDLVSSFVRNYKFQNKSAAINKIIFSKLNTENELGMSVSKIAIEVVKLKKQDILNSQKLENSNVSKIIGWISERIVELKSVLIEKNVISYEEQDSSAAKIALVDVALLIFYMYKHSDVIAEKNTSLDQQLIEVIKDKKLEQSLETQKNNDPIQSEEVKVKIDKEQIKTNQCCTIFSYTNTIYENEILNNPTLFKYLVSQYGLNKTLELGPNLVGSGFGFFCDE